MSMLDAIFRLVLDASWHASWLMVAILALRSALRDRLPARLLSWAWVVVALRLLLPISFPAAWSPFRLNPAPAASLSPADVSLETSARGLASAPASQLAAAENGPRSANGPDHRSWLVVGWAAGVGALLIARIVAELAFAGRVRRSARKMPLAELPREATRQLEGAGVALVSTEAVSSPALHGILRPRILLPAGCLERLTPDEIRLMIAHELAHARRRDLLADVLLHVAVSLHWFNPLAWLTARAAREDCELACDDAVIRRAPPAERESYGNTLLKLAGLPAKMGAPRLGLGAVASKPHLKRRIHMIVAQPGFGFRGTLLCAAALAAVAALSFTTATHAQVAAPTAVRRVANFPDDPAIAYDASIDRLDALFPNGVVATVLDRVITVADVRAEVAPLIASAKRTARTQEEFNARLAKLQNAAIKDLIDRQLVIRRFHDVAPGEQPRRVAAESIDTALADELRERYGGDREKFMAYLRDRNLTLAEYRNRIEESIIYHYMREQERKVLPPPPAPKTPADAPLHLRLIQLSRSPGETDASLLERANVVLSRLKNGESFESLAREFNEGRYRERGGDVGWLGASDFRPEFRDAAMALKKGEVSAPILLTEGCFLLFAEDRR